MNKDEPFKIGETVVLQNLEHYPEYEGTKATISGNLTMRRCINPATMTLDGEYLCYKVIAFDGLNLGPRPDQIKPRVTPPPMTKKVEEVA